MDHSQTFTPESAGSDWGSSQKPHRDNRCPDREYNRGPL